MDLHPCSNNNLVDVEKIVQPQQIKKRLLYKKTEHMEHNINGGFVKRYSYLKNCLDLVSKKKANTEELLSLDSI